MTPSLRARGGLALVAALATSACAAAEPARPAGSSPHPTERAFAAADPAFVFTDPDRVKKLEASFPAVDALAEAAIREDRLPGLALGIVIDGRLAYAKGFGFADVERGVRADADTIYRIGSITKVFTGLTVLALRDDGALSLDEPLTRLVPEAAGLVYPTHDSAPMTLRQLLTHTSGLPRDSTDHTRVDVAPSEAEILASLARLPLDAAPGARESYSTLGFELLGVVASRAGRAPYPEVLARKILRPLGMTATGWDAARMPQERLAVGYRRAADGGLDRAPDWRWDTNPGGGLRSTVRDLAKLVAMQLDAYPPRSGPEGPIRRSTLREAHLDARHMSMTVRGDARRVRAMANSQGLAWFVDQTCDFDLVVQHGGGSTGFTNIIMFLPDYGVGVVVLRNFLGSQEPWANDFAYRVLHALKDGGGLAPRVARPSPSPAIAALGPKLLALHAAWDDHAYEALLSERRTLHIVTGNERAAFAILREASGPCTSYEVKEGSGAYWGTLRLTCEHGPLDLEVRVSRVDGKLDHHVFGVARGLTAPPPLAAVANALYGLIGAWDDGAYAKHIGPRATRPVADTKAVFEKLRAAHGACKFSTFRRFVNTEELSVGIASVREGVGFWGECERGGALDLYLRVDPAHPDVVTSFNFEGGGRATCLTE